MKEKVIGTIEKYNMIKKGDGIVIGLSGGPDSTALTHVLWSMRELYDIKIFAVHLNHMIRGEEALRDEEFSRCFAASLNIPFYSKRIKIEDFAKENGMSSEEAGRYLRYTLFNEIANKVNANKIALAHNMNDQAETMIMRFLRGSGINGMIGIRAFREERYIRPIISCSRDEIESYCDDNALNPVIDSTNNEVIYARNKIRLELIPYIKEKFNPNIIENLYKRAEMLSDEDSYLNSRALIELDKMNNDRGISVNEFNLLHPAMKRRILRILIRNITGDIIGIEIKHIDECISLILKEQTGKKVNLPKGMICKVDYEVFKIEKEEIKEDYEHKILIPGCTRIVNENIMICTKIVNKVNEIFKNKQFIKYFDYDKIKCNLVIRNRKNGDYMYPSGMGGKKKLKEIFIDKKIPRDIRSTIPLIAMDQEVLCIIGIRDTNNYKVDENTKNVLEVKIERGEYNE